MTWHDGWPVIGNDGTVRLDEQGPAWVSPKRSLARQLDNPWLAGWSTRQAPLPGVAIDHTRGVVELPISEHTFEDDGPLAAVFLRQLEYTADFQATVAAAPPSAEAGNAAYTAPSHHYDLYVTGDGAARRVVLRRRAADLTAEHAVPFPGNAPLTLRVECDSGRYAFTAAYFRGEQTIGTGSAALLDTRSAPGLPSVRLGVYTCGSTGGVASFSDVAGRHAR